MTFSHKLNLLNRYYRVTKFYPFLKSTVIKAGLIILIFISIFLIIEYLIIDTELLVNKLTEKFHPIAILIIFFLSEAFTGILPPEIFIAWSGKQSTPWLMLIIVASISYLAGCLAYLTGRLLLGLPRIHNYITVKIEGHIKNMRKWGGFLVLIGATLPVPFFMTSLACGLIKFKFSYFLIWALSRYARFAVVAILIYKLI